MTDIEHDKAEDEYARAVAHAAAEHLAKLADGWEDNLSSVAEVRSAIRAGIVLARHFIEQEKR